MIAIDILVRVLFIRSLRTDLPPSIKEYGPRKTYAAEGDGGDPAGTPWMCRTCGGFKTVAGPVG